MLFRRMCGWVDDVTQKSVAVHNQGSGLQKWGKDGGGMLGAIALDGGYVAAAVGYRSQISSGIVAELILDGARHRFEGLQMVAIGIEGIDLGAILGRDQGAPVVRRGTSELPGAMFTDDSRCGSADVLIVLEARQIWFGLYFHEPLQSLRYVRNVERPERSPGHTPKSLSALPAGTIGVLEKTKKPLRSFRGVEIGNLGMVLECVELMAEHSY